MPIGTLWYTRCPVPTAFSLAIRLGWIDREFEADGLRVAALLDSPSRNVRESHFAHTQPNSFRHGGNIPPGSTNLIAANEGEKRHDSLRRMVWQSD
jgi:ABC-type nitrate/sulfonate/bicarbonate transport system substrate-binding protein